MNRTDLSIGSKLYCCNKNRNTGYCLDCMHGELHQRNVECRIVCTIDAEAVCVVTAEIMRVMED